MTNLENAWRDVGPSLGGVAAEALCAYEVWRAASNVMDVCWVSGQGHDIEVSTPEPRAVRINAKRAWRRGAPTGFLDCSPLKSSDKRPLDAFALVVLDNEDFRVSYSSAEVGNVNLHLAAKSAEIYYLPVEQLSELIEVGNARHVSDGKWRVHLEAVSGLTTIDALLADGPLLNA